MEQREVFVTLISAQDLKKVNTFGKMTVYCVAWIHPDRKVSSPMDTKGSQNPAWNATLKLMADERVVEGGNAVLVVDLYDHGTFGNHNVGSCTIPLSGLKPYASSEEKASKIEESTEASSSSGANFMAVPILRPSGKAKGTLNLSVKLGELVKGVPRGAAAPAYVAAGTGSKGYPATGYPPAGYPPAGYPQPGYAPPPRYAPQPGYAPQPAYAQAQPGYPPQQGYAPQPDYPPQPGYAAPPPVGAQPYPMPYQQAPYPGGMPAPYYQPAGYAAAAPPPQPPKRSGLGGGLGAGLVGGALGGLLLGSVIGDFSDGGDGGGCGGGGGGCGGGGCGGGCGN